MWFDPATTEPLVGDSTAMQEALRVFSALTELSPPGSMSSCSSWNEDFDQVGGLVGVCMKWGVIHLALIVQVDC